MSNRLFKNANYQIKHDFLAKFGDTIWVYLKKSNTTSSSYDPYRNTGYSTTLQSPIPIKARVRPLSSDSLIRREIGLVNIGAVEIEVEDTYVEAIKIASKVFYNKEEYTPFLKAGGNQAQITPTEFGVSKIVLFKLGN